MIRDRTPSCCVEEVAVAWAELGHTCTSYAAQQRARRAVCGMATLERLHCKLMLPTALTKGPTPPPDGLVNPW
jgi:hypothetical protein